MHSVPLYSAFFLVFLSTYSIYRHFPWHSQAEGFYWFLRKGPVHACGSASFLGSGAQRAFHILRHFFHASQTFQNMQKGGSSPGLAFCNDISSITVWEEIFMFSRWMWKQNTQPHLALVGLHERSKVSCPKRSVNHLWNKDISFVSSCVLEGKFKKHITMEKWWRHGLKISNIIWKPDWQTQLAKHRLGLLFVCDMTLCAAWQLAAPELSSGWWHLEEAAPCVPGCCTSCSEWVWLGVLCWSLFSNASQWQTHYCGPRAKAFQYSLGEKSNSTESALQVLIREHLKYDNFGGVKMIILVV